MLLRKSYHMRRVCVEVRKGNVCIFMCCRITKMPLSHSLNHPQLSVIANDWKDEMWKMKIPAMLLLRPNNVYSLDWRGFAFSQDACTWLCFLPASVENISSESQLQFSLSLQLLLVPLTHFRRHTANMLPRKTAYCFHTYAPINIFLLQRWFALTWNGKFHLLLFVKFYEK